MAQITVRQLPDEVHRALKAKARTEGRSAEALARQLIFEGLFPAGAARLGDRLRALVRDVDMEGVEFSRDRSPIRGATFE
jgi:plasmid stability protein